MSRDWTKSFFREPVFTPGSAEAVAAAPAETAAVWKALGLKKGSRVLDIACGTGRHARLLARRGARVLGVDACEAYLREARRAAAGQPRCRFVRGDMRRLGLRGGFDAAISLWTSFGYFDTPAEDERVLRGAARALEPGGLYLNDVQDFAWVKKHGQRRRWDRRADGAYLLQEAECLEGRDPRVVNEWTVLRPGRPETRASFVVRGYDKPRLFGALRRSGLTPLRSWTGLGAVTRGGTGGRLVVLARKPR